MAWRRGAAFTGHRGAIYALVPGTEHRSFLSGAGDGRVVRWHLDRPDQGELVATVDRPVFALGLDRPRRLLFIGKDDGSLHVLDMASKKEIHHFTVQRDGIFSITHLPEARIACAGGDGTLSIWSVDPMELIRRIPLTQEKIRHLSTDPDGRAIAIGDGGGSVRSLDTTDFNELAAVQAHDGGCTAVCFHPSKPVVLSGGKDGHLRAWRGGDLRPVHAFPAHGGSIYAIAFAPGGSVCATASRDRTVKLWDAGTLDPVARLDARTGGHGRSVNALAWIDGTLITAGDDRRILPWDQKG